MDMTPLRAHGSRLDRSFERLYRRHAADVYRYAVAVLRDPADAEDVTQTTFLNAYRSLRQGERPRQPQHWLIAIAHNVCRQRFRQESRRPREVAYDDNVGEWLEEEERGPSAEDLRRALGYLAFNQRTALVMRELEGRSYAEIADLLGLSVSAVETLIFRARRAVREQLEGALTCAQAERALSLEADKELSRAEKGPLRAHLRECKQCAKVARSQRAQRSAFKVLGALPLPASFGSLLGGGGAALATKAAAIAISAAVAGGVGLAGERHFTTHPAKPKPRRVAPPAAGRAAPVAVAPARAAATPVRATVVADAHRAAPAHHAVEASDHPGQGSSHGDGKPLAARRGEAGHGTRVAAEGDRGHNVGGQTGGGESHHRGQQDAAPRLGDRGKGGHESKGSEAQGSSGVTAARHPEGRRNSGSKRGR